MSLPSPPAQSPVLVGRPDRLSKPWHDWLSVLWHSLAPAIRLPTYTVATVPDATAYTGGLIYVSDEAGGAVPAFSDGTDWRRVTDRSVVS